jgi:GH25 family lysozyme M1 (1,4-beta-N-acetylmuramidase)
MKKGIDISKWQGNVDFAKVKADNIEFVILRSSYRKTVDPKFYEYVKGCKENGIPILGVYHFIYALNNDQALEEAKFCVEQFRAAGLDATSIIFSDFEYDSVDDAAEKGVTLTKADCNKFTEIFCEYVRSQGYETGIYTNRDYYKN